LKQDTAHEQRVMNRTIFAKAGGWEVYGIARKPQGFVRGVLRAEVRG
jgi:hypothetical protein